MAASEPLASGGSEIPLVDAFARPTRDRDEEEMKVSQ
jgi:hypothetical protein